MGQKTHPRGLRLGIIENWDSRWFSSHDYTALLHEDLKLRDFVTPTKLRMIVSWSMSPLGGEDLSLKAILGIIAELVGREPPRIRLPHAVVMPIAYLAEGYSRVTGRPTRVTVEGVRMSRKRMFFSSAKAEAELGYRWRPAHEALADAVRWFEANGYLR